MKIRVEVRKSVLVDIDNPESIDWHHPEEHIMDIRAESSDWQYDGCEIVGFVPGEEEWVVNDVDDVQEILDNLRKIKEYDHSRRWTDPLPGEAQPPHPGKLSGAHDSPPPGNS